MIRYERRFKRVLRVSDIFFASSGELAPGSGDVDYFIQAAEPLPGAQPFKTLHVSLDRPAEDIWKQIGSNCRYKIRRAEERDGVTIGLVNEPDDAQVAEFADYYDQFALRAGLAQSNRARLFKLRAMGALSLGEARVAGDVLGRHAHVFDEKRGRLLYSASMFRDSADSEARNRIGRANRLLHWEEMRDARARGRWIYDFGGLSADGATAGVDRFKLEFGGVQVTEYNAIRPGSTLGHLVVKLEPLLRRMRMT